MASQVAHIVYAKKYFESIDSGRAGNGSLDEDRLDGNHRIDRDKFLLGAVFPDIRMIDPSIKRKDTHLRFEPLDLDFSGLTSFEAGWKFHLYCDMRREEILNRIGFYESEKTSDLFGRPAKLLEDILLYDKYNNWEKLAGYFRNPPVVELDIAIDRETFVLWYAIIAKYIEQEITLKSISVFLSKQPKLAEDNKAIIDVVEYLNKKEAVKKKLAVVLEEIV